VSVSQLKTYLMCPRKFELHYIRGLSPEFVPVNLAFGSAFHEALAAYYGEIKDTGVPLRRDLVIDVFRAAWDNASDGPVPLQGDEDDELDLGQLTDKGVSMLHAFSEFATPRIANVQVEAVEQGFAVEIHDPDTGEVLEEQLVGTIDLITAEDGVRFIVEHKTSSKKYTGDQLRFDVQPTAYKLAVRAMGLGDAALRYQIVTKSKVPNVQVAEVARDERDEDDLLRTVVGVLRAVDAGVSYRLRGWQCRTCPYKTACDQNGAGS
jgi:CRISPR/Cas system-associated exonuclease Cas4 (RecB family)